MGHNRSGVERKARLKRHKKEVERLAKKAKAAPRTSTVTKEAANSTPTP